MDASSMRNSLHSLSAVNKIMQGNVRLAPKKERHTPKSVLQRVSSLLFIDQCPPCPPCRLSVGVVAVKSIPSAFATASMMPLLL